MRVSLRNPVYLMILIVLVAASSCGGGGGLNFGAGAGKAGMNFSASLITPTAADAVELGTEVVHQDGQVLLRISAPQAMELPGLLVDIHYDEQRYTPVVAQATGAYAPLKDSLTLELMQAPGHLQFGQVEIGKLTSQVKAGTALLEVLFNTNAFSAPKTILSVPSSADAVSPLLWDADASMLKWYYVNRGDYDQNGMVGISDLVPLAVHLHESGPFPFPTALSVVDGMADGQITIADLTPIGVNAGTHIDYYNVYFSQNIADVPQSYGAASVLPPVAQVPFSQAQGDRATDRLYFTYAVGQDATPGYYWIRPVADDQEGASTEGTRSNLNTATGNDDTPPGGGNGFNVAPEASLQLTMQGSNVPLTVEFDASASHDPDGSIISYEWDFEGDGLYDSWSSEAQAVHVYTQPGTYAPRVRVVDNGGAFAVFSAPEFSVTNVSVSNIPPTADIAATSLAGQAPLTVGFLATGSRDIDGIIISYQWDFDGDGVVDLDSGTDPTVLHEYDVPGQYTAFVQVMDNRGGIAHDSIDITVTQAPVNQLPVADLQVDAASGIAPLDVSFDASASMDPDGSITEYAWDLDGNGAYEESGPQPTISHTYASAGVSEVKLRVTDNQGAQAVATLSISVNVQSNDAPLASLSANPLSGTAPLLVTLQAGASQDPDGSIARYDYDFENDGVWDGYDGPAQVTHTYSTPGMYTAKLRVTDDHGAQSLATVDIQVNVLDNMLPQAVLAATPNTGTTPLHVAFDATSSLDNDGSIARYDYDFNGDGIWDAYDAPALVNYTYTVAGIFLARLRVTDNQGAQAMTMLTIDVQTPGNAAPTASLVASPDSGQLPLSVTFNASASSDSDGGIVRYDYDFNSDGIWDAYDAQSVVHWTYNSPGLMAAYVRVTDNMGAQAIQTATVNVTSAANDAPTASLQGSPLSGDAPLPVSFDASGSSDSDGSVVRYDYDFNNDGVWDAYDAPDNVDWTYQTPGNYTAKVRVTDNGGSQDSATVDITVNSVANDPPTADLAATPTTGNAPLTVSFDASGSSDSDGTIVRYDYDFNSDGAWDAYDGPATINHVYAASGAFTAKVRVTDNNGAQDVATVDINAGVPGNNTPTADLQASPLSGAAPLNVTFNAGGSSDTDGSIVRYDYDFNNDGAWDAYDGPASISWTFNTGGNFTAKLRVTDNGGAQAVDTVAITVTGGGGSNPPTALFTATPQNFTGIPQTVVLDPSGSTQGGAPISRYDWDLNNDGFFDMYSGSPVNVTRNITAYGNYVYKLRVTDTNGQYDEHTLTVVASGPPVAFLSTSPANPVGVNVTVTLDASASYDAGGTITKYEFDRDGNGSYEHDNGTNPITTTSFAGAGDYNTHVRVTDNDNNTSIATAQVQVRVADIHIVDNVNNPGSYAAIAMIGGRPAMVWQRGTGSDLYYARANNATGSSWGAPVAVATSGGVGYYADLVEANGRPAVVYMDNTTNDLYYLRAEDAAGSAWVQSNAITLDTGTAYSPSLTIIAGNPAVAYGEGTLNGIKYRRATDTSGTAWSAATTVNSGGTNGGSDCSLADVGGMPAVAFFSWGADAGVRYRRATDVNGSAWSGPITLSADGVVNNSAIGPSLAVINGNPAVAYKVRLNNTVRYRRATDATGGGWGGEQTIVSGGNNGDAISMAFINNIPYVAYHDESNDTLRLIFGLDANGASWSPTQLIDSGPNGAGGYIDMCAVGTKAGIACDALGAVAEVHYAYVY